MKDDRLYLIHIKECIERIEEYTKDGKKAFFESTLIQDAVIRNLQVMAESTQRLSDDIKKTGAEVKWRDISRFRNVLVHNYLGVDLDNIWDIVKRDVSKLKIHIADMLIKERKKNRE